jgi:signal transduction histidine kinase
MKLWPLSIRWKFILTIIAFTLVLAVPFGFLTITRLSDNLETSLVSGWTTSVKIAGGNLLNSVLKLFIASNPKEAKNLCESSVKNIADQLLPQENLPEREAPILYVQVVYRGVELCNRASSPDVAVPAPPVDLSPPTAVQRAKQSGTDVTTLNTISIGRYYDLRYWQVIDRLDSQTGQRVQMVDYVSVGISWAYAKERLDKEATVITLIVLGYLLLGILIAFAFSKMILGPVEMLAKAVSRFKQDRSARAKVKSGDELEWLSQEFNKMADAIEERRQELERINSELLKANKVKSEFLAVMGHELKTPLHAIRGYSQLLLEGVDGPLTQAQCDDLKNILQSGDQLLELIDNILKFSKIEAGEDKLYLEKIRVADVIDDAMTNIHSLARNKGLALRVYAEPILIVCDKTKLRQILVNLLSNAVKHTPQGKIEVLAETKDNTVARFVIKDTGVGIESEHHQKIFEPFTQVDSSTTRESSGVGLGLAIVKKYVELHGGQIGVESQPGQGSTFYFTIPLNLQASMNGSSTEEVSDANSSSRRRSEFTQSASEIS